MLADQLDCNVKLEIKPQPNADFFPSEDLTLGEDVGWMDYDASVSMHLVVTSYTAVQPLARLISPTAGDNLIS